ncbi:hypothetical protein [Pseudoalteromonas sp. MMG024]|uniref:PA3496 family putative envelope integrity protein n=1 Tax=Pseudoalteromonas sp. MMG024 TaxID=2909980 RepID=UPI001F3067BE|nr:hypothetical protein [Pseudoalteromonas sp. MMG024]MCF6459065.1 hypothetical protein [Pseudoalteromonas sp. MMG024]
MSANRFQISPSASGERFKEREHNVKPAKSSAKKVQVRRSIEAILEQRAIAAMYSLD